MPFKIRSGRPSSFRTRFSWIVCVGVSLSACQSTGPLQPDPLPSKPEAVTTPPPKAAQPPHTCQSALDLQLNQEVALLRKASEAGGKKPAAARSGLIAFAFPRNRSESQKLNQMALFAAQVFDRPDSEGQLGLPLNGILHTPLSPNGRPTPRTEVARLPEVFPVSRVLKVEGQEAITEELKNAFGTHTQIVYGFIPLSTFFEKGLIGARLKGDTQALELFKTGPNNRQIPGLPEWLRKTKRPNQQLKHDPEKLPDPKITLALLAETFCVGRGR